jgi:hypothetical protein
MGFLPRLNRIYSHFSHVNHAFLRLLGIIKSKSLSVYKILKRDKIFLLIGLRRKSL